MKQLNSQLNILWLQFFSLQANCKLLPPPSSSQKDKSFSRRPNARIIKFLYFFSCCGGLKQWHYKYVNYLPNSRISINCRLKLVSYIPSHGGWSSSGNFIAERTRINDKMIKVADFVVERSLLFCRDPWLGFLCFESVYCDWFFHITNFNRKTPKDSLKVFKRNFIFVKLSTILILNKINWSSTCLVVPFLLNLTVSESCPVIPKWAFELVVMVHRRKGEDVERCN